MPSIRRVSVILSAALLAACSSLVHGPDRPPTGSEIIGTYDMGHAGFDETLQLHQDGTYTRTLHGHLGQDSKDFHGTWRIHGKHLFFAPVPERQTVSSLVQAETFFHRHKPAFGRTQDIKGDKVHEWWVYERRENGQ